MMLVPGSQYMPMMTGDDLPYQLLVTVAPVPWLSSNSRHYARAGSGYSLIRFLGQSFGSASGHLIPGIIVDGVEFEIYSPPSGASLLITLNGHYADVINKSTIFLNGIPYPINGITQNEALGYNFTQIHVVNINWLPSYPPDHIIRF